MTTSINLGARKAVLIMEAEDGSAIVTNIYDPRIDRDHAEYDYSTTRLVTEGTNRLTFTTGQMFSTSRTDEDLRKKAVGVYDEGARVFSDTETVPAMASEDEIRRWMRDRHEDALHAVYLAGVLQGARQVQFHDEHLEKEIAQIPLNVLDRAYSRITNALAASVSAKTEKGLKKARKIIAKLRQEFASGAIK